MQEEANIETTRMDEILNSHLICPNTLRTDNFWSFFEARKDALCKAIGKAMEKKVIRENDSLNTSAG